MAVGDGEVFNHQAPFFGIGVVAPGDHILTTAAAIGVSGEGMMLLWAIHTAKVRGLYEPHRGAVVRRQMYHQQNDIAVLVRDAKGEAREREELDRLLAGRRGATISLDRTVTSPCQLFIRLASGRWIRANTNVWDPSTWVRVVAERVKDIRYEEILGAPCFNAAGEVVGLASNVFGAEITVMPFTITLSRRLAALIRRANVGPAVARPRPGTGELIATPEIQ